MKGFHLFFILAFSLFCKTVAAQDHTQVVFDKTVHDFGDIKEQDGPVTCEFIFKNTGQETFVIASVESSCGCTTPAYTKDPVKPGRTGFVKATFDPTNYNGVFEKLITVKGNTNQGPIYLNIKGTIIPRPRTILDDYPAQLGSLRFPVNHIVLGDIFSDQVDTGFIKIYNAGAQKIQIKSIKSPDHIWTKSLPVSVEPKEKIEFPFYYSAYRKNDIGYLFDRILLVTDDGQMPEKELVIVANIQKNYAKMPHELGKNAPVIKFSETEHDFGNIKEDEVVSYVFKIKNEGIDPLVIYDIKSSCGCTASTLGNDKISGGDSSSIKVTFNSKQKNGFNEKTLTVFSNDPVNPQVFLTIKAMVFITSGSNKKE
jgi:hypothetical protein